MKSKSQMKRENIQTGRPMMEGIQEHYYMASGPGKYDEALTVALKESKGQQGVLIVIDGADGPGFSAQLSYELRKQLPTMLRDVARQIEADVAKLEGESS